MKNSHKIGAVFGAVIVTGSLSQTAASFANADISPVATVAVAQSPEQPVSSGGGRQLDNQVIPGTAWFEIPADQLGDGPGEQSVPRDDLRPSALPNAGGEGMGLTSAAALISVAMGGVAVALRSRKQD